jgi:hypothetical protein
MLTEMVQIFHFFHKIRRLCVHRNLPSVSTVGQPTQLQNHLHFIKPFRYYFIAYLNFIKWYFSDRFSVMNILRISQLRV